MSSGDGRGHVRGNILNVLGQEAWNLPELPHVQGPGVLSWWLAVNAQRAEAEGWGRAGEGQDTRIGGGPGPSTSRTWDKSLTCPQGDDR